MNTDTRIEAFRQTVERLTSIPGQLQTIGITLARSIELPGIAARCACPLDTARFREEQIAIGSPLALRFRKVQLENELRQGWGVVGAQMRAASDAATGHVVTAAGGLEVAKSLPFARRHLVQLARHRHLSATASTDDRLAFLNSAWLAVDAAMASLGEIRCDARNRQYASSKACDSLESKTPSNSIRARRNHQPSRSCRELPRSSPP